MWPYLVLTCCGFPNCQSSPLHLLLLPLCLAPSSWLMIVVVASHPFITCKPTRLRLLPPTFPQVNMREIIELRDAIQAAGSDLHQPQHLMEKMRIMNHDDEVNKSLLMMLTSKMVRGRRGWVAGLWAENLTQQWASWRSSGLDGLSKFLQLRWYMHHINSHHTRRVHAKVRPSNQASAFTPEHNRSSLLRAPLVYLYLYLSLMLL